MTYLYHPNMRDTRVEVAESDVKAWQAQGWQKTKPKESKFEAPAKSDSDPNPNPNPEPSSGEDEK